MHQNAELRLLKQLRKSSYFLNQSSQSTFSLLTTTLVRHRSISYAILSLFMIESISPSASAG